MSEKKSSLVNTVDYKKLNYIKEFEVTEIFKIFKYIF